MAGLSPKEASLDEGVDAALERIEEGRHNYPALAGRPQTRIVKVVEAKEY